jgi:murein DD-endopeptidase MepM/ murein hydrolase activator NlpD
MDSIFTTPTIPLSGVTQDGPIRASDGDQEALGKAVREFEAILLRQMLEGLRELFASDSEDGDDFGGEALFDTLESELARQLSEQGGLGLAEGLVRQTDGQSEVGGDERFLLPGAVAGRIMAELPGRLGERALNGSIQAPFGTAVTSDFGWRADPIDGTRSFHAGVDVKAAFGVEVPAVRGGQVTFVGEQPGYGLTVVVGHDQGETTRYAHLSALLVQSGEQIASGQPIGRVGQSGRATGPHLHFEMARNGRRVDPGVASVEMGRVRFKESDPDADSTVEGQTDHDEPLGAE